MFKTNYLIFFLMTGLLGCLSASAIEIKGGIDRETGLYRCGENATFRFEVLDDSKKPLKQGKITLELSNDGGQLFQRMEFDLADNPTLELSGTMTIPGFLRCRASMKKDEKTTIWKSESAGYEVEKITPGAEPPEDFKQFWDNAITLSEKTPLDPKTEKLSQFSNDKYECYKVSFANFDERLYGFLTLPKGVGPFPALISVPGAGRGFGVPRYAKYAEQGVAVLEMNVLPFDPSPNVKELEQQYQKSYWGYFLRNVNEREKYFYYRAILGINRAVNYLAQRPNIDAGRIGYFGQSQGGAFGFFLGGLNSHIGAILVCVPAMCDFSAKNKNRAPAWPYIENAKAAPYYDCVNFAAYIKCPFRIFVGFGDVSCTPSSSYAAYNCVKSDKKVFNQIGMGHTIPPAFWQELEQMIKYLKTK
ncbi:MAG: acetylxylan esterase [Victivallales bacterium]|jgi:cephalosporin-C deacetylase-like acetyl esterase|nr:acetylxylan esterase [Victivallales bacterium]